ncbi:transposase [Anaeromyxobacter paludicola]|uniref:Transposase n=1 Tax=Anaeromyxobacter paludicola TaxID=2918171 RepID=A0ABN6NCL2_9BACT|nr:transposase [Anaeromyxobacter paludicola]BDG09712.1 transposase [Anaeromyxobacter paludicola]
MPRTPRSHLVGPRTVNHCMWRSRNHELVLASEEARRMFRSLLLRYKDRYGILIHSYCLMGTHPHIVVTCTQDQAAFSAFFRVVNQRFARWYNTRNRSCGQVIMERLRSPQIQSGEHLLTVMRYGDLNPVRAGLCRSAKDWSASSYRHYAHGERDPLITDASEYEALGSTPALRRAAYRNLFAARWIADLLGRRREMTCALFIGDPDWVAPRLAATGLSPPAAA